MRCVLSSRHTPDWELDEDDVSVLRERMESNDSVASATTGSRCMTTPQPAEDDRVMEGVRNYRQAQGDAAASQELGRSDRQADRQCRDADAGK
jgi:hypothetical protein